MGLQNMSASHIAAGGDKGEYEPQRAHAFQVEFDLTGIPQGEEYISLSIASGFLPTEGNEIIRIDYLNDFVKVAGKATYDMGSIEVIDYVDRPVADALNSWRRQVFDPVTGKIGLAKNYKKVGRIILLSPDRSLARIWKLEGCWIPQINWGRLDMSARDQPVRMAATIAYDRAIYQAPRAVNNLVVDIVPI